MDMDLVMELTIHKPLYYVFEKTSVGLLSKLALNTTSRQFVAEPIKDDSYP